MRGVRVRGVRAGRWSDDRGAATVWAALSAVVLCGVFGAVFGLGQAVAVRHQAGAAADLAALAAADRALEGQDRACALARRVAGAQGASVSRCAVRGEVADLDTGVRWGPFGTRARARAGPVNEGPATAAEGARGPPTGRVPHARGDAAGLPRAGGSRKAGLLTPAAAGAVHAGFAPVAVGVFHAGVRARRLSGFSTRGSRRWLSGFSTRSLRQVAAELPTRSLTSATAGSHHTWRTSAAARAHHGRLTAGGSRPGLAPGAGTRGWHGGLGVRGGWLTRRT